MKDNLIEFPMNDQIFFEKAIEAFEAMNFDQALSYMEKMNRKKMKINEIYLYATLLFQTKQVERALELVEDYEEQFLDNEEMALLFVQILIHNRQFFKAQALTERFLNDPETHIEGNWLAMKEYCQNMMQLMNESSADKVLTSDQGQKLIEKVKKNKVLTAEEQVKIVEYLENFFQIEHLELIEQLLVSDWMDPFVQRSLIEILLDNQVSQNQPTIQINWMDGIRTINLKQVMYFDQQPIIKELSQVIDEIFGDEDPTLAQIVSEHVFLQLMLIYPLTDEVITDPYFWILQLSSQLFMAYDLNIKKLNKFNDEIAERLLAPEEGKMFYWLQRIDSSIVEYQPDNIPGFFS